MGDKQIYTLNELEKIRISLGKAADLTGQKFGKLTALFRVQDKDKKGHWACICDCGNYCVASSAKLKNGDHKTCGLCSKKKDISKGKWNIKAMNDYCAQYAVGYHVLDAKYDYFGCEDRKACALIKCPNPDHPPYWIKWRYFVNGKRCEQCTTHALWDFDQVCENFLEYGYTVLEKSKLEYKDSKSYVYCSDNNGFIYKVQVSHFKKIVRRCQQNNKPIKLCCFSKINEYCMDNVRRYLELYRPDYRIVSTKYIGMDGIYTFEYLGDELPIDVDPKFEAMLKEMVVNKRHPRLSISEGELRIKHYFEKRSINFVYQKAYEDCKDKDPMPFDFYVVKCDTLIEYQGRHHYEAIEKWGGQAKLEYTQQHDRMKAEYCKQKGIKLIVIPYWEYKSIEKILDEELKLNTDCSNAA